MSRRRRPSPTPFIPDTRPPLAPTRTARDWAVLILSEGAGFVVFITIMVGAMVLSAPLGPKFAHFIDHLAH